MDILSKVEEVFEECLEIVKVKNTDYSPNEDSFGSFEVCEFIGICSVENGILVRMTDKLTRIANLLKRENAVKDESIEDTIKDLINYSALLLVWLRGKKKGDTNED